LPNTLWGRVRKSLIGIYGEAIAQAAGAMGVKIRGFEC